MSLPIIDYPVRNLEPQLSSPPDLIEFACPNCGVKLKTSVVNGGKRIRCKKCDQPLSIPEVNLVEPDLDEVFDPKRGADPVKPLREPGDPLEFDFDTEDIDTILARAKQAEAEEARLAEESKALKARAEKLRQEKIQKAKSSARPKTAAKPQATEESKPTESVIAADQATSDIPLPTPVEMPDVDGDELLTQVDEIAVPVTGDATDREEDLAPLQVEGITSDDIDVDDLYGVKCGVCDTRIHVTEDKVGTEIECPICFSPVRVIAPKEKTKYRPDWIQPEPQETDDSPEAETDSEELKLSDPIERPKVEHNIEPGFGLPDVDEDLLAPVKPPAAELDEPDSTQNNPEHVDEIPKLQVVDPERTGAEKSVADAQRKQEMPKSTKVRNSSLPQQSVESHNMQDDDQTSRRERFEQSQDDEDERPISVHTADDLETLTIKSLNKHVIAMITDARLIIPTVTAIIMLTVGDVFYDMFQALRGPDAETGFGHAAKLILSAFAFLAIYGCGTLILWYVCSVVFRESARGKHKVESWRSQGYDEVKSTFLLFACSFALAGLPFMMLRTFVSAPIRILIAPLLLLVAWFNQNAFIGVAFEPFATFRTQSENWKQFYIYVTGLALITLVGGLLFYVPYCSIIAATIIAATAIAFAAATGWQVGRAVKMMEDS